MPAEPQPVTVAQVVHRAIEVTDPEGGNDALADLLERFEDEDEPIAGVENIDEILSEAVNSVGDPDIDPELTVAQAVAVYLAHRRDELGEEPVELLRLAVRAEFDSRPPRVVEQWLREQEISW
jgi:hypothetical protein